MAEAAPATQVTFKQVKDPKANPLNLVPQFGPTECHVVAFGQDGFFTTDDERVIDYLRTDRVAKALCREVRFENAVVRVAVAVATDSE
jgi:hypothetical protein